MEYNNENARRIEDLVESKSFHELTFEEKKFVLTVLGSEEVYASLRKISKALVANKADLSPDPRVLAKLRKKLKETRPKHQWLTEVVSYRLPAYIVAPSVLLVAGVMYFSIDRQPRIEKVPVYVSKVDTVYMESAGDTVVIERVVVKYEPAPEKKVRDYAVVRNVKDEESEGVSMKDKEELESFLVSGS